MCFSLRAPLARLSGDWESVRSAADILLPATSPPENRLTGALREGGGGSRDVPTAIAGGFMGRGKGPRPAAGGAAGALRVLLVKLDILWARIRGEI